LLDEYLLRQFPGRTLDELDEMDLGRHLRAFRARSIRTDVEIMERDLGHMAVGWGDVPARIRRMHANAYKRKRAR